MLETIINKSKEDLDNTSKMYSLHIEEKGLLLFTAVNDFNGRNYCREV